MCALQVFTDGCSKLGTTGSPSLVYPVTGNSPTYVASKGRFGGNALQCANSGAFASVNFPGNPVTTHSAFAFQFGTFPSANLEIWHADDANASTTQCSLAVTPSGTLQFYRGGVSGTAIGSPSTATFAANTLYQLEISCTIDPSTGYLEVRLNGNATPLTTFTGNTRSSANSYASRLTLGTVGNGQGDIWYSDIMLFDTGGSAPNTWVGNVRVNTLVPSADSAGDTYNTFSTNPSQSAGNHYLNVDSTPAGSGFNFAATSGDIELYATAGLPANSTGVVGVNVWIDHQIDAAGSTQDKIACKSGGTIAYGSAISPPSSYAYASQFFPTDPNTSAPWAVTAVNAALFGAAIV